MGQTEVEQEQADSSSVFSFATASSGDAPAVALTPVAHATPSREHHCSVCWSPLCKDAINLFPDSAESGSTPQKDAHEDSGDFETGDGEGESKKEKKQKKEREVITTKCGHVFHSSCLLETKIRKPECPMCRAKLTPITNPLLVSSHMTMDSQESDTDNFQATYMRDAVIHASHRGRNAVRLALERKRIEKERVEADAEQLATSAVSQNNATVSE